MRHSVGFQPRLFAYQKWLILSIIVLKYQMEDETTKFRKHFEDDLQFCAECFRYQDETCEKLFENLRSSDELEMQHLLSFLPVGEREISVLKIKNTNEKIIAKYLPRGKRQKLNKLRTIIIAGPSSLRKEKLAQLYHKEQAAATNLDGMQFCPIASIQRFVDLFKPVTLDNELTIWLYLMLNVQPLLMPLLSARQFPVPVHHASCGFSIFQQQAGQPLSSFYGMEDYQLKLRIAKQLLKAMIQFSEGFEGFRVYVTDLNADNIVYNEQLELLSLVDLDTVYLVDSRAVEGRGGSATSLHKHDYIECMDCFAYSPQDICQRSKSDINIFAACQLLREDLKKDLSGGFLQPIPTKYTELIENLDECVDCPGPTCDNRFEPALAIIRSIEKILKILI